MRGEDREGGEGGEEREEREERIEREEREERRERRERRGSRGRRGRKVGSTCILYKNFILYNVFIIIIARLRWIYSSFYWTTD